MMAMPSLLEAGVLAGADGVAVGVVEGAGVACVVMGAAKRMLLDVMAPEPRLKAVVLDGAARGSIGVGVVGGGGGGAGRDAIKFASRSGTERREDMLLNVTRAFSQVQDMLV